ncbi:uncharacterized protein LAJ45_03037 [Morchella importuna]|uniref:uncharacterized protein n=1 Tax=Morchella importuna TaxID=1174673 RepID=UPI001E8D7A86|nr:uncharacterized protein LAJ45_03037 [Morchella importuna]KAH8152811.1 hypothetical protein LAJ45_03037 [Morchella importuna]
MDTSTPTTDSAASFDKLLSLAQQAGNSAPTAPRGPSPYVRLLLEIATRTRNVKVNGKEYVAAIVEAERAEARYAARKRVYLRELEYEKTT